MQRGAELFEGYVGEPKHYFKKAAHHLHLDYLRQRPLVSAGEPNENTGPPVFFEEDQEEQARRYACLEECLRHLTDDNRHLGIAYHEKKQKRQNRTP